MGVKKYIVFAIIFLVAVGSYVYSFEGGSFTLNLFDIPIKLPIAAWIIIPAALLFFATILHFLFYGIKDYVKVRAIRKDSKNFLTASKYVLLGKNNPVTYKTDSFKLPGAVLNIFNIDENKASQRVLDEEIQDIIDIKEKLNKGEVVDLKKYALSGDNPLEVQNRDNQLEKDPIYAESVLKNYTDEGLYKKAYLKFATFTQKNDLKRYNYEMDRDLFNILIDRINDEKHPIDLSDDEIIGYLKELDYKKEEFIELAKKLQKKMNPDRLMLLFDKLSNEFLNTANEAYLYILFELQMMDTAREFLENSAQDEYMKFKYMLFLKDQGKNFDTEIFV